MFILFFSGVFIDAKVAGIYFDGTYFEDIREIRSSLLSDYKNSGGCKGSCAVCKYGLKYLPTFFVMLFVLNIGCVMKQINISIIFN